MKKLLAILTLTACLSSCSRFITDQDNRTLIRVKTPYGRLYKVVNSPDTTTYQVVGKL